MKSAFRLGMILVPFLFLLSTTAYPASTFGHHSRTHRRARSIASVDGAGAAPVQLSEISSLGPDTRKPRPAPESKALQVISLATPVTPPFGSGIGVAAPVFSW